MTLEKIDLDLEIEDGYPPISVERLNARALGKDEFEILNTPFFAPEIAYGDIVIAPKDEDGRRRITRCVANSPFKALSIIILADEMDRQLMDDFRGHDCVIEYGEFGDYRMLAVGVPPTADYGSIKDVLDCHETNGKISYAELVA